MKAVKASIKQIICLAILMGITLPAIATTRNKSQVRPPMHLEDLLGVAAFNDARSGFEIGNHKTIYNLTGFYSFNVDSKWEPIYNDVFTEVGREDSETMVEIGLEEDLSFRQVSEYVQYMLAKGWKQVAVGKRTGFRKDRELAPDYVESIIRVYKEPGETVVFRIGTDLDEKSEAREVNRILNTFELIPKPN